MLPTIEHNTIYGNTAGNASGGGGTFGSGGATIRNNIFWENRANGALNQIQLGTGSTVTYSCVQNGFTGTGNLSSNPSFVTTTFHEARFHDDFYNSTTPYYNPAWNTVGAWGITNGVMSSTVTGSWRHFYKYESDPDVEVWFSYKRANTGTGYRAHVQPRYGASGKRVELEIYEGQMLIGQHNGTAWTTLDTNDSAASGLNVWYHVYMKVVGGHAEVWRRSDTSSVFAKVLETDAITVNECVFRQFSVSPNADFHFDDVRFRTYYNLDEFLQLSGSSLCIDTGAPPPPGQEPTSFRDFGDQLGLLDGNPTIEGRCPISVPMKSPHHLMVFSGGSDSDRRRGM